MITNFKKATKKNKEEQTKIDDNPTATAEDNNVVMEDSSKVNKENS